MSTPRFAIGGLAALVLCWGCARNPVTGKREIMLVSEAGEIQAGREASKQVAAELGLLEDPEIERVVRDLGLRMARASERPGLPWEFHVVDSPVVNAFALPGGFIYLTRGILTHMNNEAEMVGVLGHEIGHVTARHSAQRMSQGQLAGLGLGLGMIFVPEIRPFGDALQGGLGLLFLKFGRDDERQADALGVGYSLEAGYDASRTAAFFDVLDRMRERSNAVIPGWLSTHPDPADRSERIRELARAGAADLSTLDVGEERFKRRLEGMMFGENPREGFMDGNVFKHPDLRFQIRFPESFQVQNTKQALYAGNRDAAFQLTVSRASGNASPQAHLAGMLQRSGLETGAGRSLDIRGFSSYAAPFRASTGSGVLAGEAAVIRDGDRMYEIFVYTEASRFRSLRNALVGIVESFSRLDDPRALAVQPQRIRLYRVPRTTSARQALRDAGVTEPQLEEIALLNNVRLDDRLERGTLLKSVTPPPATTSTY